MAQIGSTFHTHRNHILPYYPKNLIVFPYLRQYQPTPSLLNNPEIDSHQDIHYNSTPSDDTNPFEQFQPHTSINHIALLEPNSHLPPMYQNLPHSSLSHTKFDDSSNSTDSDSEMLHKPIYHSASFPKHFLALLIPLNVYLSLPLIIKLHLLIFELLILHIIFCSLPFKVYNTSKPNISFPLLKLFSLSLIELHVKSFIVSCLPNDLSLSLV